jgi:hypothetical protein
MRRKRSSAPPRPVPGLSGRPCGLEHFASRLGRLCPYAWAEVWMAGAYSRDLRSRVLAAVEAGESVEAAARRFAGHCQLGEASPE